MKDRDAKILEEAYENLFAGIVEDDNDPTEDEKDESSEEKEEKKETEKSEGSEEDEKEESSESEKDEKDESEESESEEKEDDESDDDSDNESESDSDSDDSGPTDEAGGDKGIQSKIQTLQKQYNDILVDAFEKYAPDCIEDALNQTEASFGEDIESILDTALDSLKGKILGDLGIEKSGDELVGPEGMGMGPMDMNLEPEAEEDQPEDEPGVIKIAGPMM